MTVQYDDRSRRLLEEVIVDTERPPETVYHYTTLSGLKGILERKLLWCSHVRYLNDMTEYIKGLKIARDVALKASLPSLPLSWQTILSNCLDTAETGLRVFVASFSDDGGDRLSQWRGYCNSGAGFSVGFDTEPLRRYGDAAKTGYLRLLRRCIYSDKEMVEFVEGLNGKLAGRVRENLSDLSKNPQLIANMMTNFAYAIAIKAATLKHRGFNEEREWRLIGIEIGPKKLRPEMLDFHQSRHSYVPHLEIPLCGDSETLALNRITIGPSPHPDDAAGSVRMLLEKYGVTCGSVVSSEIPFRFW